MEIRKDIFGEVPEIGDTIVFNPPRYKGLVYGICVGFTSVGLPKVELDDEGNGTVTPKTGFVVKVR